MVNAATDQLIVLVHGFTKNNHDMAYLSQALTDKHYRTFCANLPTTFGRLAQCVAELHQQIQPLVADAMQLHLVGHSMGGLIVREYIRQYQPQNLASCICIATPHRGAELADWARFIPMFANVFQPINDLTTSLETPFFPERKFKIGVMAGTENYGFGLFLPGRNDGLVTVNSALAPDADASIALPFGHLEIHHQARTARLIKQFIRHGNFTEDA